MGQENSKIFHPSDIKSRQKALIGRTSNDFLISTFLVYILLMKTLQNRFKISFTTIYGIPLSPIAPLPSPIPPFNYSSGQQKHTSKYFTFLVHKCIVLLLSVQKVHAFPVQGFKIEGHLSKDKHK